ncbi:LysR family transcriptional regulator [Rhodovulum sp. PH10]|uniref:LysR family transcriptional regulator n=1 Tax=Rhodovulum sp. PH10 TaxID=1187851 RepID=UPI00192B958E|nr:LysR family transcriptional regulator [Rhodovulum sp. PH10]
MSLHLSQPALSQCIRQLEDHIGSPLFSRTTRSVSLAPLGMSFLPHARDLLSRFDALTTDVQEVLPSLALPRNAHSFIRHRPLTEPRIRRTIRMFWKSNVGLSPAAMAILASMHDAISADRAMTLDQKVDWKLDELKRVLAR